MEKRTTSLLTLEISRALLEELTLVARSTETPVSMVAVRYLEDGLRKEPRENFRGAPA